jgi:hypothetical protein
MAKLSGLCHEKKICSLRKLRSFTPQHRGFVRRALQYHSKQRRRLGPDAWRRGSVDDRHRDACLPQR